MRALSIALVAAMILATPLPLAAQEQSPAPQGETIPLERLLALPGLLERAALASQAGDFSQAILDYSLFLLFNPTLGQAWHERGVSYMQNGDLFRALLDFGRALDFSELPQDKVTVLIDRAWVYLRQDRFDDALADLDSAILLWPDEVDGRLLRARIHELNNRPADARADYDAVLQLMPGDATVLLERGAFFMRQGDSEAAANDFRDAVAMDPTDGRVRAEQAVFLATMGDLAAALAEVEEAMRLDPANVGLILLRASLLRDSGAQQESAGSYLQWLYKIRVETIRDPELLQRGVATVDMGPGRSYIFAFEGRAGDRLRADAASLVTGEVDPLLVLTDETGTALVADDDGGEAMDARIDGYLLPQDGRYRLVLGHAGGPSSGTLRVELELEAANAG